MSTTMVRKEDVVRKWYVLDAAGKPLGKTAALAADLLRGKRKVDYTPHVDCGDFVIIINAKDAVLTGNKLTQKYYRTHSGYAGGLKETRYDRLMATRPTLAMTLAVSSCMVVPMVIIMSLYGACEGLTHMPGGILTNLYSVPAIWMINIPHNFVMALPWNLLVAGPISHFVFRRAFPVGTVFEEEHAELLEQAMAPECE